MVTETSMCVIASVLEREWGTGCCVDDDVPSVSPRIRFSRVLALTGGSVPSASLALSWTYVRVRCETGTDGSCDWL